jgi:signal transduction histidine kinase
MIKNEKQTDALSNASIKDGGEQSAAQSGDIKQLQNTMDDLLVQVDQQREHFRIKIADLLAQVGVLREAAKGNDARDDLVLQLRTANQNLVIATFDAQDMQAAAEAVNSRQDEFLSMLAHELRNPLAPIAMAAEHLGKIKDAHPALPKLHAIIGRQVSHMTHLVDELVDVSRVRTGKITLHKQVLLLSEIIDSAVETSQPFVDKRHQQLSVDLRVDLRIDLPIDLQMDPIIVDGDLVRLSQVFSNLLINATKFTQEHGRITVSAYKLANTVTVLIKDNGLGIAHELQPFIFDLFTQGPRSLDRSEGGLGIGLSLVRTIVEMHGGTVAVHSEGEGFGSEFRIQLPVSAQRLPHHGTAPATEIPARACRILVIEDNADTNSLLNNILAQEGHIMTSALDGRSGLALAKENIYDVIICDIGLPGMNGYEVIEQLRLHSSNPLPCLIAMTGYNQAGSRARATEAGFDHYLVKPVVLDNLRNLIPSGESQ